MKLIYSILVFLWIDLLFMTAYNAADQCLLSKVESEQEPQHQIKVICNNINHLSDLQNSVQGHWKHLKNVNDPEQQFSMDCKCSDFKYACQYVQFSIQFIL